MVNCLHPCYTSRSSTKISCIRLLYKIGFLSRKFRSLITRSWCRILLMDFVSTFLKNEFDVNVKFFSDFIVHTTFIKNKTVSHSLNKNTRWWYIESNKSTYFYCISLFVYFRENQSFWKHTKKLLIQ